MPMGLLVPWQTNPRLPQEVLNWQPMTVTRALGEVIAKEVARAGKQAMPNRAKTVSLPDHGPDLRPGQELPQSHEVFSKNLPNVGRLPKRQMQPLHMLVKWFLSTFVNEEEMLSPQRLPWLSMEAYVVRVCSIWLWGDAISPFLTC